ncbi:MAG: outer membrane beta-barrel protein [Muribaculaceae bacterium]|nr:outer membrane beta-barrel protein [Muribaculaceae bacterium]
MIYKKIALLIVAAASAVVAYSAETLPLINRSQAGRFVTFGVHAGVGNSFVTENYESVFPSITDLSMNAGWAFMAGATVEFAIRDYLSVGTELNVLANNHSADMIIHAAESPTVSNVFLKNHYYSLNIPVYASLKMNLASTVRWNVDAGLYYSRGLGGSQRQTVYNATINHLGQQILSSYTIKTGYFGDRDAFINSARRSDVGLHLATGFTFHSHYSIGVRTQIGFKNVAYTEGITNPNVHNFSFLATLGYNF